MRERGERTGGHRGARDGGHREARDGGHREAGDGDDGTEIRIAAGQLDEAEMAARTLDAYEELASVWEASTDHNLWNELIERRALRSLLPELAPGTTVLDAGCAAGAHAAWLARRGCRVVPLDRSPAMLAATAQRPEGLGARVLADLGSPLPFADAVFEVAICSLTLHYLREVAPTLSELRRVIRRGGVVVVTSDHPFAFDAAGVPGVHYFSVQRVEDRWTKQEVEVAQSFWRRPLGRMVDAFSEAGLVLERVAEPEVDDEAVARFGQEAAELVGRPTFIGYRLRPADRG